MPFQKVSSGDRAGSGEPRISMRKSGSIGFNQETMSEYFDGAEYTEIFFDEDKNRVGFRPSEEKTEDAYTVSMSEETGSITPMSFLNKYQLIPDITTQYKPQVQKINKDVEVVSISLDDPVTTYGKPKDAEE